MGVNSADWCLVLAQNHRGQKSKVLRVFAVLSVAMGCERSLYRLWWQYLEVLDVPCRQSDLVHRLHSRQNPSSAVSLIESV